MPTPKEKLMSEEVKEQVAAPAEGQPGTTNPATEAPAAQGPDLNISDLLAVKNIIEVATSRGAFKAAELEAVGKSFNKLNSFLEAVSKKEA
jgi:hypothetical protein